MKQIGLIIIISIIFAACVNKTPDQSPLEIYIVSGSLPDYEYIDINILELEKTPILTLDDIQKYYWENQTFIMKNNLIRERLNKQSNELPVPTSGLPYVVVVNGERIYMGKFWTMLSSHMEFYVPIIFVEGTVGKNYGQYDLRSDQQLYAVSRNELIDDDYEAMKERITQAVFDQRIYEVLKEAGLLCETEE